MTALIDECKDWDEVAALANYAKQAQTGRPPKMPGVYGFWDNDICLYVGQTKNLSRRLGGHERKREFPGCTIRWAACANHVQVEPWLIAGLSPRGNGHTKAAADIRATRRRRWEAVPLETRLSDAWSLWPMLFGESLAPK